MYTLSSDRLRVVVSAPGESPNTTVRFDRTGFIEEVALDGVHRFCASEPHNLSHISSGGRGICNEFKAYGDVEAPVGGRFVKPGVGIMHKEHDGPYMFMHKYKYEPFQIYTEQTANSLLFTTMPEPLNGFALLHEKRIEVYGNKLTVSSVLENVGEKAYIGNEYCHNFLTVNSMSLGPDYLLTFPAGKDRGDEALDGELRAAGRGFTFTGLPVKARMFSMGADDFETDRGGALEWTFINSTEGAQVRVCEYIDLERVTLWAADHMFSAECFHKISLAPGQSCEWSRSWEFDSI